MYERLNASFQGVRRVFVLAYATAADAANDEAGIKKNRNYFLPRGEIKNYYIKKNINWWKKRLWSTN